VGIGRRKYPTSDPGRATGAGFAVSWVGGVDQAVADVSLLTPPLGQRDHRRHRRVRGRLPSSEGAKMEPAMATAAKATTYPHIETTPDVRSGKACIEGTRIAVVDIVGLLKRGMRPEEMLDHYMRPLTLAQVHASLTYYYDHTEEIEAYFERAKEAVAEVEANRAEYLGRQAR
jgi:uncharacterized protein (DUF433 family)